MKRMSYMTAILLLAGTATLSSCRKEGCTNALASNYKTDAKKDDGTCTYSEKLIIWQDQTTASSWANAGVNTLKFYIDNQYIGSCSAVEYMVNGKPTCNLNGQASVQIDMGKSTSKTVNLIIKDEIGIVEWVNTNLTIQAGTCNLYQIQ